MEKERVSHESFGQLSFTRTNGTANFFGSELKQDHYITMKLKSSEIERDLTRDWYHANKLLAKVRMTAGAFSEMITSMNQGEGVCCTVEFAEGRRMEPLPVQENRKEFVHRKFEDRMKEFANTIREKQQEAKQLVKKKSLSKEDVFNLTHHIEWLTGEVERNIPLFMECFQETMDEVVFEAKLEVENAIQHKISTLGLNALHDQNKLLK